jgi:hypothetical protein
MKPSDKKRTGWQFVIALALLLAIAAPIIYFGWQIIRTGAFQ